MCIFLSREFAQSNAHGMPSIPAIGLKTVTTACVIDALPGTSCSMFKCLELAKKQGYIVTNSSLVPKLLAFPVSFL